MRKMKKTLAILAIVAMVLTMVPLQVFAADSTRLAGADRIATAIAIADAFGAADTVILAAADDANLVDSLAVAPLAGTVSPIYLTYKNSLDAAVKAKLSGKKVIAIGAVSDAVVADAKTVATSVEKVSGADRLATNDLINAKLSSPAGTFVVGYNAIPDALSVASFAAANNYAIVLANLDGSVDSAKIEGSKTYIIGGPTLVKDITGATRLFGADRFDTNVEVIKELTFSYGKVYIANGVTLVDALAASSLAAKAGAPIVLTDNSIVKAANIVNTKLNASSAVIALGGTGVVSNVVQAKVGYGGIIEEPSAITVNALTEDGRILSVDLLEPLTSIDKSDVRIFQTASLERVGIESVELSPGGLNLEVTLYDTENADEIERLVEYTITIGSLKANFTRPGYVDAKNNARVIGVDSVERTITFDTFTPTTPFSYPQTLDIPAGLNFDFQGVLGQEIKAWFDGDDNLTKYQLVGNKVLYGSIEINDDADGVTVNGKGTEYDIDPTSVLISGFDASRVAYTARVAGTNNLQADTTYDYAKLVLNKSNDVEYIQVYEFEGFTVVEKVDGEDIIGYDGTVLDTEDDFEVIVKNGQQISTEDVVKGDIIYFNEGGDGFAEVYNDKITGEIEAVYNNAIKVNGVIYDTMGGNDYDSTNAKYLDNDGDYLDYDNDAAEDTDGEANFYLDRKGDLVYVSATLAGANVSDGNVYITTDIIGDQSFNNPQLQIEFVDEDGEDYLQVVNVHDL
ncbi:MAG: cell wall-binding repeat-containing protein, partial [Desulfitobacteriaceae bacterium]|nr:cell wall-binding repeat-containing protein [Desulfitobacteriaceae bacterium]